MFTAQVLVDAGVEIGFADYDGNTASDLACANSGSPDCLKEKIIEKIGEREQPNVIGELYFLLENQIAPIFKSNVLTTGETQLYTYFNVDFESDDGIINDGHEDLTETNRDCNEKCQNADGEELMFHLI